MKRSKSKAAKIGYQDVLDLVSHRDRFPKEAIEELRGVIESIREYLPNCGVSIDEMIDLLLILQCNAHAISGKDKVVLGLGIYPAACYLNHSCDPNVVFSFSAPNG